MHLTPQDNDMPAFSSKDCVAIAAQALFVIFPYSLSDILTSYLSVISAQKLSVISA